MTRPEIRLGPPSYPLKGELETKSKGYKFIPTQPVTFLLRGPYGSKHETTLMRDLSNHVIIHCEEVELTLYQLELLTLYANAGLNETSLGLVLGLKHNMFSMALSRARQRSKVEEDGVIHIPERMEFMIRMDRLGLLHPDLVPSLLNRYFVPIS